MHKKLILVAFLALILIVGQSSSENDKWQPLRFFEGIWQGQGDGMSGVSTITQEYQFILRGTFLLMKTKSIFEPQEKNPKGEIHEDWGIFSYDQSRETYVLRGFYVEGFVNQYVLDSISEDKTVFTFVTEQIENAPPGTKAKLEFKILEKNELEQSFFVAFPGQEYTCYSVNKLKRSQ